MQLNELIDFEVLQLVLRSKGNSCAVRLSNNNNKRNYNKQNQYYGHNDNKTVMTGRPDKGISDKLLF